MQASPNEATVASILHAGFGKIISQTSQQACLNITYFYFLEGEADASFAKEILENITCPAVVISSNPDWYKMLQKESKVVGEIMPRQLYEWSGDPSKLNALLAAPLSPNFEIRPIGKAEATQLDELAWSEGIFDSYGDRNGFLDRGLGYCIAENDKIVAVCLAYSTSPQGIEIEVDTDPEYQGRGLGKIVSAQFIQACLNQGAQPVWDATNPASGKIAEALGFRLKNGYDALYLEEIN